MPEERVVEETVCFREHYITWRGLILFLQRISQKEKKRKKQMTHYRLHLPECTRSNGGSTDMVL